MHSMLDHLSGVIISPKLVLVRRPSPPPPHAKACVSRNCDTNVRIKFIFDTAIDDLEWKSPIEGGSYRFWQKSEFKMAAGFVNTKHVGD